MRLIRDYHGAFRHPMRAFLIGIGVIVLTLSGFALAAGISPSRQSSRLVVTRIDGKVRVVTQTQPVLTTVVSGRVQTITLPGTSGQVVVVRVRGKHTVRIVRVPAFEPATSGDALQGAAISAGTVTETVYDPVTLTVTGPASTVTETVTEPPTTTTDSTNGETSP